MALPIFRLHRAQLVGVAVCISFVAILAGAAILLARDRINIRAAVMTSQNNLALGLERDILRNIDIYDLSLRSAAAGLQFLNATSDPMMQNAILFDGASAAQHFRPIVIAGPDGVVIRAGVAATLYPTLAGRPVFDAHRLHDELGLLVRMSTSSSADGRLFLSLSRRIRSADGSFGGVVAGGLDLAYLIDIFSRFTLPAGGTIALTAADGRRVVGFPPHPAGSAQPFDVAWLLAEAARETGSVIPMVAAAADDGVLGTAPADAGGVSIATVRRLGNLPFFLVISTPRTAIYAEWMTRAWVVSAGLLVFFACTTMLIGTLWRELTRRRQAERDALAAIAAARIGAARLATYVDQLADGLLAIRRGSDGQFVYEHVNDAAADMLGIRPQDAIGRAAQEVWPGPVGAFAEDKWRECLAADATLRYEQVLDLEGGRRTLRFVLAPVRDLPAHAGSGIPAVEAAARGPVTLLLASMRDVSLTIDLEEKLRQTQRMEAVGQLTAGVAHDFNNMLQAQLGALELLTEEVTDRPHALELATLALSTGQHGARLTHSLLSFSRQQHLAPQAVPVAMLLDGLQRMLARTLGPLVTIEVATRDGAAPEEGSVAQELAAPFADMAQLEAALLNLALNARDAMPSGGHIRIETRGWREADGRDVLLEGAQAQGRGPVLLAVTDTGSGMSPAIMAKACEPFFTTKGIGKGSGLGLSMVQGFVQQSGGVMRIRSVPGHGTRIELWLPAAPDLPAGGPGALSKLAMQSGRILLVDDTPDVLCITAELLEAAGFTVVQAASGEAALAILGSQPRFDVLVTDYTMPGMDGGSLVRAAQTQCAGLPALIVTGQADIEGLRDLPPHVDVVRKPLGGRALAQHVCDVLEGTRPEVRGALAAVS